MPIHLTKGVKTLVGVQFLVFLVQHTVDQFFGGHLLSLFALNPFMFAPWQWFTYGFLQADVFHLFFDSLILLWVGGELEAKWGTKRFLRYYLGCSLICSFLFIFLSQVLKIKTLWFGSQAVMYSLLLAYTLLFGERMFLFMLLIPLRAKYFIWVVAAFEIMNAIFSPGNGFLSCFYVLGGILSGLLFITVSLLGKRAWKSNHHSNQRPKVSSRRHLRLVANPWQGEDTPPDDQPKTWH